MGFCCLQCRSHDNAKMAEEQVGAQKGSNPEDQKPIIAETSVKVTTVWSIGLCTVITYRFM